MSLGYLELALTLAANESRRVPLQGNTLAIYSLSGSINLRVDDLERSNIRAGIKIRPLNGFTDLYFEEVAGAAATILIAVSDGDIEDNRLTVASTLLVKGGDTLDNKTVTAGVAATQLVAADPTRNQVIITNTHATDTLYIGKTGVTTVNGTPILAKGNAVLETGAAVYGIRGGANDIDTRILEIKT